MRRGSKGMTLLETAMALTLISSFIAGLFLLYRSQQETVWLALGEAKGPQQAMRPLGLIRHELANLKALTAMSSSSIRYTSVVDDGATIREIALAPADPKDPRARPLQLTIRPASPGAALPLHVPGDLVKGSGSGGDAPSNLSEPYLVQNHNPDGAAMPLRSGIETNGPVPIFTYLTGDGSVTILPSQVRRVEISLILRSTPEASPRTVRTSIALRNR